MYHAIDSNHWWPSVHVTRNTSKQQALAHSSYISLENPGNVDNLSKLSKRQIVLSIIGRGNAITKIQHFATNTVLTTQSGYHFIFKLFSSYLRLKTRFCFIKPKRLVRITCDGLINDKRSILTILLLNNGCSYQDPVLVAILRYFVSFSDQTYHFEERHFSRWQHFPS